MRTRSDAEPRRDVLDLSASEVCDANRVAPPTESRDTLNNDSYIAFVYSRGPYTGIQVTRVDVRSLYAGQQARDALVDALARYIWHEELSSSDARSCPVFCSVFYTVLRECGPTAMRSMTQRVNVFDYSTWVVFVSEGKHGWCADIHDVPRLERALKMSADELAAHTVGLLPPWRSLTRLAVVVPQGTLACASLFFVGCVPWRLRFSVRGPARHRNGGLGPVCMSSRPRCLIKGPRLTVACIHCLYFLIFLCAQWRTVVLCFARVRRRSPRGPVGLS